MERTASLATLRGFWEIVGDQVLARELVACGLSETQATTGFFDYLALLQRVPHACEIQVRAQALPGAGSPFASVYHLITE